MKKIKFLIISIIIFTLFSCLSSPDTKYQEANKYREKAIKYNLKKYVEKEYDDAEKDFQTAKNYMDNKKNFKADRLLDTVNKKYQIVLEKGFPPCAEDKNKTAVEKKESAKDIKANVAVKDIYEDAEKTYNEAVKLKEAKDYEKAIDGLEKSEEKYKDAFSKAKDKKDKADKSFSSTEEAFRNLETLNEELLKRTKEPEKVKN